MYRVGQNRIYAPDMTVYLVLGGFPAKKMHIHRIHLALASPTYVHPTYMVNPIFFTCALTGGHGQASAILQAQTQQVFTTCKVPQHWRQHSFDVPYLRILSAQHSGVYVLHTAASCKP
jgi:hypothetical protein